MLVDMGVLKILERGLIFAVGLVAAFHSQSASAQARLEVREVLFGFHDSVSLLGVKNKFQPVSIKLANKSSTAFDGEVELYRCDVGGRQQGAKLVRQVFLSPGSERWVQFHVQALRDYEDYMIAWQSDRSRISGVRLKGEVGLKTVIYLEPGNQTGKIRSSGVVQFPERLFPPDVVACETLDVVILDHVPDWTKQQREAFMQWLEQGGEVRILQQRAGEFPSFSDELSPLNLPASSSMYGLGRIVREPETALLVENGVWVTRNFLVLPPSERQKKLMEEYKEVRQQRNYMWQYTTFEGFNIHAGTASNLKGMIKADHNWLLIGLMAFAYLTVIFPGCFLIGRERRDYRHTFGVLIGGTAIFSFGFYMVGRRGYDEQTAVRSIGVARQIGGDEFYVSLWSNIFVTTGGDYHINYPGPYRLFSTAQAEESVNGKINFDDGGSFPVDIPPYSSRSFFVSTRVENPGWAGVRFDRSVGRKLYFHVPDNFPAPVGNIEAVMNDRLCSVTYEDGQLVVEQSGALLRTALLTERGEYFGDTASTVFVEEQKEDRRFQQMLIPLIIDDLGISRDFELDFYKHTPGRIRLYFPIAYPDVLLATYGAGDDARIFPNQRGRLVLVYDLPLNNSGDAVEPDSTSEDTATENSEES
ncbi:hypothetical protein [Calycomorphotria hydatis]|uniref:Uncharacterized protein n=1 Tax=Calycomorphotria hydatis TaxID=2528027 RepID=A0A517T8X8_9PLAN|nr:hypothetical protein [Calycomorphotria hydatis]QDT64809.1 hypothetical protein V22_20520 [Calycomorphotria hydatis]